MVDFARKTRDQDITSDSIKAILNSPPLSLDVDALDIPFQFQPQHDPTKVEFLRIETTLTAIQKNQIIALFPELEEVP